MVNRFTFNTIALFTTDNQKMVDFYCDIFGFETKWNGIDIDVEMRLGDMRILFFPRVSIEKMTQQNLPIRLASMERWRFPSMYQLSPM